MTNDNTATGFGETPQEAWDSLYDILKDEWPDVTPGNVLFYQQITPSWSPPGGFVVTHTD